MADEHNNNDDDRISRVSLEIQGFGALSRALRLGAALAAVLILSTYYGDGAQDAIKMVLALAAGAAGAVTLPRSKTDE